MKRLTYLFLVLFWALSATAQDKMFASYQDLISDQGDVVTTLNKSKRSINQIYMSPGADYEIYSQGNKELTKYLK